MLKQAYPSGANIDDDLVDLLFQPTQRRGAAEAFRGFINLFDDYLAPQLMAEMSTPVDLIWGEQIPGSQSQKPSDGPAETLQSQSAVKATKRNLNDSNAHAPTTKHRIR